MRKYLSVLLLAAAVLAPSYGAQADSGAKSKTDNIAKSDSSKGELSKADYILQPLDVLKVQVFGEDDINRQGEVRISQEYTITLPFIGTLDIRGKTAMQVREMVRERYDRDYIVDPQVQVNVLDYYKRRVNVVGQVTTPGEVPFPQEQGMTLVEAISRAGGGTRLANLKKVILRRLKPDGSYGEPVTINVEDLMKGDSTDTWPLQPGDVITVPERSI